MFRIQNAATTVVDRSAATPGASTMVELRLIEASAKEKQRQRRRSDPDQRSGSIGVIGICQIDRFVPNSGLIAATTAED